MQSNNTPSGEQEEKLYEHKSWSERVEILARWVVDLFALPVSFLAAVLAQFFKHGGSGARFLGGLGFGIGTLISADGIWQVCFQGTPLFPWFEKGWIGWQGWIVLPFNLLFWSSIAISALIQIMEARTLRGKTPDQAKKDFETSMQYKLPAKPQGTIDYTRALWADYKAAGMKERNSGGVIAAGFWIFDLITTFASRNPFSYTNPAQIMACLAYNLLTMVAGEVGYNIWEQSKKPR